MYLFNISLKRYFLTKQTKNIQRMKSKMFILLLIGVTFLMCYSCQKEQQLKTVAATNSLKQGNGCPTCQYLTDLNPKSDPSTWCIVDGKNCLPWVFIYGNSNTMQQFTDSINIGPGAVAHFFSNADSTVWDKMFPYLAGGNNTFLINLQSGNYSILSVPVTGTDTVIFKAYDSSGDYFGIPVVVK
jgi:hypothetical protein